MTCSGLQVKPSSLYHMKYAEGEVRLEYPVVNLWPWGPLTLLYNEYQISFPGVKRPGRGVDHPPPSGAEVKERV